MKFHMRGFVSFLLSLALLVLSVSGVVLYVVPRGRVANWTGWTMLGLSKDLWQSIHIGIALVFLVGALVHLWLNWGLFWAYVKRKAAWAVNLKLEMLAAVVLTAAVVVGAIYQVPPLSTLMDLNSRIKDSWDDWAVNAAAPAPAPHAEEQTLEAIAADLDVSLDELLDVLKRDGLTVGDGHETLAALAEHNKKSPGDVYAIIRKHFAAEKRPGDGMGRGKGQGRGMGQGQGRGRNPRN